MNDYIIFMERTQTYQILKEFASEQEAEDYARTVVFDESEIERDAEERWAELSGA